jgi:hypothetical protein
LCIAVPVRPANALGPMVRSWRASENARHRVTDRVFRDVPCRLRTRNAPAGFVTLKPMGHSFAGKAPAKGSIRLHRTPDHGTTTIRPA